MKKMFFLVSLLFLSVGCDKINALIDLPDTLNSMNSSVGQMNKSTASMNSGMGTTNVGIHNQTLKLALDGLNDKSNWDVLAPAPFKLMTFGKAFAEEATADELMLFFDLSLLELNQAKLDQSIDLQSGETVPYLLGSKEYSDIIQEKMAKYAILSIIAGFTPQNLNNDPNYPHKDVVGEIVAKHITGNNTNTSGRFRQAALAFLALRATFIDDVLMSGWIMAQPLSNIGIVEEAINYAKQIDYIDRFPKSALISVDIKPQLHVVDKIGGTPKPHDFDLSISVNPNAALNNWKNIRTGIEKDLKVGQASIGVDLATADANLRSEQERVAVAIQIVNDFVASWTKVKP